MVKLHVQSACGTCSLFLLSGSYGGAADMGNGEDAFSGWFLLVDAGS